MKRRMLLCCICLFVLVGCQKEKQLSDETKVAIPVNDTSEDTEALLEKHQFHSTVVEIGEDTYFLTFTNATFCIYGIISESGITFEGAGYYFLKDTDDEYNKKRICMGSPK